MWRYLIENTNIVDQDLFLNWNSRASLLEIEKNDDAIFFVAMAQQEQFNWNLLLTTKRLNKLVTDVNWFLPKHLYFRSSFFTNVFGKQIKYHKNFPHMMFRPYTNDLIFLSCARFDKNLALINSLHCKNLWTFAHMNLKAFWSNKYFFEIQFYKQPSHALSIMFSLFLTEATGDLSDFIHNYEYWFCTDNLKIAPFFCSDELFFESF